MDVIALHPDAGAVLGEYGLHCFHCAFNTMDSVEAGARSHGLTDTDIENLVIDLNELMGRAPLRPQTITLTKDAALALKGIAKQEGKTEAILRVTAEQSGGFSMEFEDTKSADDAVFTCEGVDDVYVIATQEVLWRVGGAVIDFREGKFKLDLAKNCACGGNGCTCEM